MKPARSTAEHERLRDHHAEKARWLRWGPYLAERQWGTVREDYSAGGDAWNYFPHDHARSRAYRWGEDGLLGICDSFQRLCFAMALWNGRDPILKERLFGLTNPEGNHGEDVKELYYYLDSSPSHAYMRALYKYPQAEFPYEKLIRENARRTRKDPEYEITDTGVFDDNRYWDVEIEYAKADVDDLVIRITAHNRGPDEAELAVLPTLWFRNRWSFGLLAERPSLRLDDDGSIAIVHEKLGTYHFYFEPAERLLFTENETNTERIFGEPNATPFVRDAFHRAVVEADFTGFDERRAGTKAAPLYRLRVPAGQSAAIRMRLIDTPNAAPFDESFEKTFEKRRTETDEFYASIQPEILDDDLRAVQRQAFAGLLWSKQFYEYDVQRWLAGDPGFDPPAARRLGRNAEWKTLNNEEIILMPDKWEYPWYAAWDLAFHAVTMAMLDAEFAKKQLILFLREWYMHPNGQLPAYEWALGDVNPPVHAWACLQVYLIDREARGEGDIAFLKRVFQKLLINFTWWINRKDSHGDNIFEGGFLGLDNIGVIDRSAPLPGGGRLEQADSTAWMGLYCLNMLDIAIEIAQHDPAFEDVTTKFFEHFTYIATSINRVADDWISAWDDSDGFYYDVLALPDGRFQRLRVRSLVGLMPLFAVSVLPARFLEALPDFARRLRWFQQYRMENGEQAVLSQHSQTGDLLLSLLPRHRLERLLEALLDEAEFLSPGGIRSLSKRHEKPYIVDIGAEEFCIRYEPGESTTALFGGNSNWRGPVWVPVNYLLIQAVSTYFHFYGPDFKVAFPSGSGEKISLLEVADRLSTRLIDIFRRDKDGRRPVYGDETRYAVDPHFRDLVLFYEYFHGDTARGLGASHQTGWTALVARLIDEVFAGRQQAVEGVHKG
jgi:hypothetical protein